MKPSKKATSGILPDFEIDLQLPIPHPAAVSGGGAGGDSLSMVASLVAAPPDSQSTVAAVVDILGSAVAESTGWRPPESLEEGHGQA